MGSLSRAFLSNKRSGNCKVGPTACKGSIREDYDNRIHRTTCLNSINREPSLMDFISRFEGVASQKLIRRLAWITVAFTYFLVSLGSTVRVNNAGLGCPDWPLCYGNIFSMESVSALLEESHRYTAS